jgi:glycosyltransferase involved in cell wall biosynthesis/Tfp pilus assembly protein PilF
MTTLALSMIVRNAAKTLPQCLDSVRGVVQEIVVADTGSSDLTVGVARSLGARVISIPWRNNFAEARNRCLDEVRSDWVLSLDADELLEPSSGPRIERLISNSSVAGYQVTIRNFVLSLQDRLWDKAAVPNDSSLPSGKQYPAYVDHQNVRLFRNRNSIRFVGRVHESVGPSLVSQKCPIASANYLIYHFGLVLSAEDRAAKNILYRELGRQKLRDKPDDAQAHLELGLVEMDNFANLDEALHLFRRACQLNARLAQAWFFHGLVLLRRERCAEALQSLAKAESLGHRTALVAETQGDAFYNLGSFPQAASSYQTALRRDPPNPWVASKLGLALVRIGNPVAGLQHLTAAIQSSPAAPELYDRLMLAQLSIGNLSAAALALESKLIHVTQPAASDFLRIASLWSKAGDLPRASQLVDFGLLSFPEDQSLLMARGELSTQFHTALENSNARSS